LKLEKFEYLTFTQPGTTSRLFTVDIEVLLSSPFHQNFKKNFKTEKWNIEVKKCMRY